MSDATALTLSEPTPQLSSIAEPQPLASSAITRCADAFTRTYKTELARGLSDFRAEQSAKKAFRAALPPLVGHQNIRDFIACVAHGILLDALNTSDSSKLLYAAQVALAAVRAQPAPQNPTQHKQAAVKDKSLPMG